MTTESVRPLPGFANRADGRAPTESRLPATHVDAEVTDSATVEHVDLSDLPIGTPRAKATKRVMDVIAGIPLCVAFALAYPFVALALKLTSKGPVLFRQERIGHHGQPIAVFKFRSMNPDAEQRLEADPELYRQYVENGFKIPANIDPRITRVGRFIRKTSIDELPQALCLLQGSMSLVGPRPILADELPVLYGERADYYLACKPGLTGLWQVSGRSTITDDGRVRLDMSYAANWCLTTDIRILFRTVPVVLSAHGAH